MMRGIAMTLALLATTASFSSANTVLMDASGVKQIPGVSTSNGLVAVISSPGTPSLLTSSSEILAVDDAGILSCRGATLSTTSPAERTSLASTSLVAGAVIVDGITDGDIETGLSYTRHARTLTALFRARIVSGEETKQTLMLGVLGAVDESIESNLNAEVASIFEAAAVGTEISIEDAYDVQVVSVESDADARQVMSTATEVARASAQDSTLSAVFSEAQNKIRDNGVTAEALDPPQVAQAFLTCRQAYAKEARTARAKIAAWKGRVARGLLVDGFGNEAEGLLRRTLDGFDTESLASAGLPAVASHRLELRNELQSLVETSVRELFGLQISNLEKSTLKKFQNRLLQKADLETAYDEHAASMRSAAFAFDTAVTGLEVRSLGLTKDKANLDMSGKLNDALQAFPDSPAAQIRRTKQVTKTTGKEKKPGERSLDFGLDLVAMIRPDGFGSFQGFAGYQLGGNSITVGVHNDADDPQVISQFGGVRPPLLRVQPKLRVDMEM
mmetsp:Transcript_11732/g.15464  ORF Transcript_11732/g.15464 Transcript_11732/m.15464 type:complete len:502 (-) Transcript_11732:69-1574(-)